ncbi:MAG: substrate-binding domain-containing protein [Gemmatimonadaceae bacterium]|nr:substrate-binding domain-containing protein [Gloeobacterales cyanobacterium ES-bin-141]
MLPTEAGKRLYTQVADAIERLESVGAVANRRETPTAIRLGAPQEYFSECVLGRLHGRQGWRLEVNFALTGELVERLNEGQLDAVIATQKIERADLEHILLAVERFWLVGPPDTGDLPGSLGELERHARLFPLVAYGLELPIVRRFWRQVFGRRLDAVPELVLPDLRAIRFAVARGSGFSVLPDYLCRDWVDDRRLRLWLAPEPSVANEIWLTYRRSARYSAAIGALLALLQSD